MSELERVWTRRYQSATPWESGRPCAELQRVLEEHRVPPSRALELGCGRGVNAIYLASRGFEVTALDIASDAIEEARRDARAAGVDVRFMHGNALEPRDFGAPFAFVLDRGLYQHARTERTAYEAQLRRVTAPGSLFLAMMPNANETGRPVPRAVRDYELCLDFASLFRLVQLRECRFEPVWVRGTEVRPLMWSALYVRKK